ncbi:MAG: ABC transporter permease [Cyclobacteriaceae bacterium]
MLKNYIKITFRNLVRNRVSTIINLLGLSLGISVCLLLFLLIDYELNFDEFHTKKDNIFRVTREESGGSAAKSTSSTPFPMREAMVNDYPELIAVAQIYPPQEYQLKVDDKIWLEPKVMFADSSFFKVFDFPALQGNPLQSFKNKNVAVVTESMARNRFGDESPVGQMVSISEVVDVEIVGVIQDPPKNSHLTFSMVVVIDSFNKDLTGGFNYDSWNVTLGFTNYIVLPEGVSEFDFEERMAALPEKYLPENNVIKTKYALQPLSEIHFDKAYAQSNSDYTIDTTYLLVLGLVGVFILLLACINFINLSTAVAIKKAKEVGVRKVMGASRIQLVGQYMGEAFVLTFLSALVALGIAERALPSLNSFLDTGMSILTLSNPVAGWVFGGGIVLVSILSGLYPAWVLSGYKPVAAMKAKVSGHTSSSMFLRRGLVTFQFVISQVLIIGTIVVASQMNYFRSKPLGFDSDQIVTFSLNDNDPALLHTLKTELLSNSNVQSVSFGVGVPTSENDINSEINLTGVEDDFEVVIKTVDFDYMKTFDLQLAEGRWFLKENQSPEEIEFLINETAARELGYSSDEALGKEILFGMNDIKGNVVGVVEDFHVKSLREAIKPIVMFQYPKLYFEGGVKISSSNIPETIEHIKKTWEQAYPGYLFTYEFLDDAMAKNYSREEQLFSIFKIFAGISIGIGCLGLFGLISFMVVQKTKEVGVRKVLGASVAGIVLLFSKDFMKLLFVAFLIAAPLSWYAMGQWLSGFAYQVELSPYYFLLGGLINLVIAFLTIGYQARRAGVANPIDSLRDE